LIPVLVLSVLLVGMGPAQAQDAAPEERVQAGALVFKKCAPCHQVGPNAKNGIGPVLNGVVGRPAGQYPQYTYSSATKESGMTWDEPALTRYLRAPSKVVPGTRMAFAGLQKDQEISAVIAYLKHFAPDGNQARP
jgi:cytochrome c